MGGEREGGARSDSLLIVRRAVEVIAEKCQEMVSPVNVVRVKIPGVVALEEVVHIPSVVLLKTDRIKSVVDIVIPIDRSDLWIIRDHRAHIVMHDVVLEEQAATDVWRIAVLRIALDSRPVEIAVPDGDAEGIHQRDVKYKISGPSRLNQPHPFHPIV